MTKLPKIETERLILRAFAMDDAPDVQRFAGDWNVANNLRTISYPYPDGLAEEWIGSHEDKMEHGEIHLAIALRDNDSLIGSIGLIINRDDENAELGFWIGKPHWGKGYCTEAAQALTRYGFDEKGLNRIHAFHMTRNPASGKVLTKLGMTFEGCLRKCIKKWDVFEDVDVYSILRDEYSGSN
ncbi:MAG: GNAT family N-acetyltransferase [Chloroflexota bacterium]|nr:GNAT family N-acetyltransferase [Chloroflexota bacterium]